METGVRGKGARNIDRIMSADIFVALAIRRAEKDGKSANMERLVASLERDGLYDRDMIINSVKKLVKEGYVCGGADLYATDFKLHISGEQNKEWLDFLDGLLRMKHP